MARISLASRVMDATKLLEAQHKEVDSLIAQLENGASDERKAELFAELADNLAAHTSIEEQLFYPAVMEKKTEDLLLESVEEHLSIKRLLADMLELEVSDDQFSAKLSVLKEQLEHHAHEEEEKDLFPKVRKMMDKDELAKLGADMESMFETLLAEEPRNDIPGEIDEAASLDAPR